MIKRLYLHVSFLEDIAVSNNQNNLILKSTYRGFTKIVELISVFAIMLKSHFPVKNPNWLEANQVAIYKAW